MVLLSRALSASRELTPWLLRVHVEGWFGGHEYAPWAVRMLGSGVVGYSLGRLFYTVLGAPELGIVVGLVIGLGLWVWTWFAFSEMEE